MTTRFVVPTLALLAAIPAAHAFDVAGDGWELSIEPRIQSRIEFGSTSDSAGNDADPWNGETTENPRQMNFFMRRARIYFKGKSEDGWKFNYTLMADGLGIGEDDKSGTDGGDDRDNADLSVRYANIAKTFKGDGMSHTLGFGLMKNTSSSDGDDSSSKSLFPNGRHVHEYAGPRSVGFKYELKTDLFSLRTGIAEGLSDQNNDYMVYARVASSLMEDWKLKKRSESYLGKEGLGHLLSFGVDLAIDGSDEGADDALPGDQAGSNDDDYVAINIDYLLHYNNITALAEVALLDEDDVSGIIFGLQGGYAVPLESGNIVEAAARIQYVDNDRDEKDEATRLVREGGDSGTYFDLGVNYYLDGHSNKLQAGVQIFAPEEGDGDGFMFRLAHQIDF